MKRSLLSLAVVAASVGGVALPLTLAASPAQAAAATLAVPGHYRTISAAVAAAHNGDTILVSPGTYRENITIDGKYVTLKAQSADPSRTVIAAPGGRSPVMFQHVPYRRGGFRAGIQGFRIAYGSAPSGQGGAITAANGADPLIMHNLIEGNHAYDGGGILVYNQSNPTIASNTIRGNTAVLFGGGIFVVQGSSPTIKSNLITQNRVAGGAIPGGGPSGGGIYLENNSANPASRTRPVVWGNVITNNSAAFAGGGIMLRVGVNAAISRNSITGNDASYGGGIHIETAGSSVSVVQNRVSSNSAGASAAYPGSGNGGGISVYGHSNATILNNIISSNAATRGGAGIVMAERSVSRIFANTISSNYVTGGSNANCGGGAYIANADATMANNVFFRNRAMIGGGLCTLATGSLVLVNNTIVRNTARAVGHAAGGGIYIGNKTVGKASIVNNIFAANNDYQVFEGGTFATYSDNLIDNSGRGAFFSFPAHDLHSARQMNGNARLRSAGGNVVADAEFANVGAGVLRLTEYSPAIDAGRSLGAPSNDIRGTRRPWGGADDIGAYEFVSQS